MQGSIDHFSFTLHSFASGVSCFLGNSYSNMFTSIATKACLLALLSQKVLSAALPHVVPLGRENLDARDSVCTNSPTTRSCWSNGFSVSTDMDQKYPNTGVTVSVRIHSKAHFRCARDKANHVSYSITWKLLIPLCLRMVCRVRCWWSTANTLDL